MNTPVSTPSSPSSRLCSAWRCARHTSSASTCTASSLPSLQTSRSGECRDISESGLCEMNGVWCGVNSVCDVDIVCKVNCVCDVNTVSNVDSVLCEWCL